MAGKKGARREKNQRMAAMLAKTNPVRLMGRCPVCYKLVKNGSHPGQGCFEK